MAFGMIQTIQYIRCDAVTPPELGDVVFYWTDTNTCVLEVPDESVEAYKAAAQWGDFINTTTELRPFFMGMAGLPWIKGRA